jgi:hypothetical protein
MGQQVNVTCPDDLVAALDRVAAARRMARPELVRAIFLEAVEAHDAGRLAFRREDGPRLDASISALVVQLREALIETTRMQNENLRFAKRLQESFTGSEETVRAALEKVWAKVRELNRESFRPFVDKVGELTEHLEAAEERMQAAVGVDLSGIDEKLDKMLKVAGEARVEHNLILGDNRMVTFRFLVRFSWFVGAMFIVLFLAFAQWSQPVALHVATGLINSDERQCRLVNRNFGITDCLVPKEAREKALAVIAAGEEEPDAPEAEKPKADTSKPDTRGNTKGSRK